MNRPRKIGTPYQNSLKTVYCMYCDIPFSYKVLDAKDGQFRGMTGREQLEIHYKEFHFGSSERKKN